MSEPSVNEPLEHGRRLDPPRPDVPVEDSPVPAGPATVATVPGGLAPSLQGPDRLVLGFPYRSLLVLGVVCILFAPLFLSFLTCAAPQNPFWGKLAFVLVIYPLYALNMCRWFILPRITFDKEAGVLILGWKGLRGRRPLSSVIGVQVMQTRKQSGGPESTVYQMNLILDDPAERRLNVMTNHEKRVRATARLVADFLGVPVLDCAGPPAAAAAKPMPKESWTVRWPVVTEPGPDVLLIRSRRLAFLIQEPGMKAVWWLVVIEVLSLGVRALGVLAAPAAAADFFLTQLLACCIVITLAAALLGRLRSRWACFDRARGVLTLGRPYRRTLRPLTSLKAVQVMEGARHQLHLVPDDPNQPRLLLLDEEDAALVRRAAERVASFLGVPLLGATRPTPGAAEAVNPLEGLSRAPLPPGKATVHGPPRVVPKGEDVLVLRPCLPFSWRRLVLVLVAGIGLELGIVALAWFLPPAAWGILVLLAVLLPVALAVGVRRVLSPAATLKALLLYRDHFDRQAGLLTLGWFGRKGTYPLEKVLAVQLIPGGLVDKSRWPFGHGRERVSYQLNLVMADACEDRLHLTDDCDLEWTRQAGRLVADFLGVPVLDQIADGG